MLPGLSLLALAGVVAASWEPHELVYHAMRAEQPATPYKRDLNERDSHPCKVISDAYKAAGASLGDAPLLNVKPSVGIACMKSVPLDKKRDLALLKYLTPYVEFQSTLEVLANPPETYLFHGVDVLGGLKAIEKKLNDDKYESQYDFMVDVRSVFAAANDNHFDYPPALLNIMQFVRKDLGLFSLSRDGTHTPEVFIAQDVFRANRGKLDYYPSAISRIDGIPINEWLENDAIFNIANYQDPDAQFNNLFMTVQRMAMGSSGSSTYSSFEIPDYYTVKFRNGSEHVINNTIIITPTTDFSKIETGEDIHNLVEITPTSSDKKKYKDKFRRSTRDTAPPQGFPEALVQHSLGSVAGYFLEGDKYKDTAVLSIRSFLPIGLTPDQVAKLNFTSFILEGRAVVVNLFRRAQKDGRDKLIIDVSANGGGSVFLAYEMYRLLFPHGEFSAFDRFRANEALEVLSEADFEALNTYLVTLTDSLPVDSKGDEIKSGSKWFGPYVAAGKQNVTEAYQDDLRAPFDSGVPAYINGENEKYTAIHNAVFKPENIVIVTDGTCASACGIFTGLLTRNHNIRTLAFGGRPHYQAMQAMGGVRGSRLNYFSDIQKSISQVAVALKDDEKAFKALEAASDVLPSLDDAPLLPLFSGLSGGRLNSLSAYAVDDLDGYPLHFQYEAANCRLFYTQAMTKDVTEQWRYAHGVAWTKGTCVRGSTTNEDGTMGSETVKYNSRVRSNAFTPPRIFYIILAHKKAVSSVVTMPSPHPRRPTRAFIIRWFWLNWTDLLAMAIVGGITMALYHAPISLLIPRTFPITFDKSGDIIYPEWAYPDRGWIVPSWIDGLITLTVPFLTYVLAQYRIKSAWDASNAIVGTTWAVILASLFQVTLKQLVGGFRPYFLDVCMPDVSRAKHHNATGLNGVGFQHIMYTIEVCTQPDRAKLKNAITSFPSGHASATCAGFGFLFLWLNAKLKVWADHKPAFWKLTLTFVPLLGATLLCGTLTIDAAHNWYDIVAGAVIGLVSSYAGYRTCYAAVWDWRFNHLPLRQKEAFTYKDEEDCDASRTLSRSAGWGTKREWLQGGLDSATSSTTFARRTSGTQGAVDEESGIETTIGR
ncbi:hypothetical protein BGZ63DRAFT_513682 [Mariannaea sp. PMI_226]|nr:hypothetical protein BGZ63DRAFT_513682 [Mariannaea sp. PMI_226]